MPQLRTYRVFISHAWHRSADYYRVEQFLSQALFFRWENLSVPEHDPLHCSDAELEAETPESNAPGGRLLNNCRHVRSA